MDEIDEALKPGSDFWKWDAAMNLRYVDSFTNKVYEIMRRLMRHRERYIRAWMAHYKAHPADVHLVTQMRMDGAEIFRVEFRTDTDRVAELVKAGRQVRLMLSGDSDYRGDPTLEAFAAALKPFDSER